MLLVPLIWIVVIVTAIFLTRRYGWGPCGNWQQSRPGPLDVLERRFAEGDLSVEEYRERRSVLAAGVNG